MAIDFTVAPYFDDFDEAKKFIKIMFRPGYPVQTRELNQIQSILQNQLSRLGDSFFKDGEVVVPGESFLDTKLAYVKVETPGPEILGENTTVQQYVKDIVGSTFTGATSGMKAKVIAAKTFEGSDPITIFVKYENSGSNGSTAAFSPSENISSNNSTVSGIIRNFVVKNLDPTGFGSAAFVNRGVYYVNKTFALVDSQTIILDKYSTTPSYKVGFDVIESFVTPATDESLNDNATGTLNYEAPGAHRYKLDLVLNKYALNAVTANFVEVLRVKDGILSFRTDRTEYSVLEKTLAERTYDESGDYTVRKFPIQIREHRNNDRGAWASGQEYVRGDIATSDSGKTYVATNTATSGSIAPTGTGIPFDGGVTWEYTASPQYNAGLFFNGEENKLAIGIEPGKAYIRGYKIDKIATDYITIEKARTSSFVNSDSIPTRLGSYVFVTGVIGVPDFVNFGSVSLYDTLTSGGNVIGSAKIRGFEFESGTIGTSTAVYRLYLFDILMSNGKSFARDVKRIYHSSPSTFTANISPVIEDSTQITGSVSVVTTGTTVTGHGTRFTQELKVGDYVRIGTVSAKVGTITNDTSFVASESLSATPSPVLAYLHIARLEEANGGLLLFPVGQNYIETIRAADKATLDTTYYVTQKFVSTAVGGALTFNLNSAQSPTTLGSEFDQNAVKSKFVVIKNSDGVIVDATITSISPTSVTLSVAANTEYTIFAPVFKRQDQAKEKTKTLVLSQVKDFTTSSDMNSQILYLGKADVIRIRSVKMATATGAYSDTEAVDVSDRFSFNNGQTDSYYGISYLSRNADAPIPTGSVRVVFDYYDHSAGDYFSVDSYPYYNEIPFYSSQFGVIPLRDVLDFRPRVADAGTSFAGGLTQLPKMAYPTILDYHYYLPRRDKISMNEYGKIIHDKGTSSLNPVWPESNKDAMLLYKLSLDPYTMTTRNVYAELVDNKRYTMRDIGKIEKRVDNLEYYTTLSLLEQDTINMEIVDEYGLNRHKAGFIVDSFSGHGVGDTSNPDYRCSIDMENKILRPYISTKNVGLVDGYTSNAQRASQNYRMTGDVITLPYTTEVIVDQPLASRTENINPFAVYIFVGNVSLTPPSDDWFETSRQPDIIRNVEGNFDTIVSNLGGLTRTVWNAWQTQWTGTSDVNIGRQMITSSTEFGGWLGNFSVITSNQRVQSTTTTEQSRTGIQTSVVEKVDRELVEDRTLSTAVVPFIRNRPAIFVARKLKPNTIFNPSFDDIDVSEYVTPATKISYDPITGNVSDFDFTSNVGNLSNEAARLTSSQDPDVAFGRGDVVYVKTRNVGGTATSYTTANSPATAIVALQEESVTGGKSIYVVNVKGAFLNDDIIEGTISGARVAINQDVTSTIAGGDLVTNSNGDVVGVFDIPSNDKLKFRTGSRRFRLSDEQPITPSTAGVNYVASGILETKQATFNAVRNAELVTANVSDSRTVTSTSTQTRSTVISRTLQTPGADGGGGDPLAQTFTVDNQSGAFLTSVDVFFASKDESIPVTLEIREVVNGYPGKVVLPFSRKTLTPNQVDDNSENGKGSNPTSFVFDSPVYVSGYTEYAIVLLSDSNGYNVWIANMGEKDVITDNYITSQPSLGVLFKSQNASTWTADQMQDLKFRIHRAKFPVNVTGDVKLVNQPSPRVHLAFNPFKTTTGSNVVRIYQADHGNYEGSKVTISNVVGTQNGISAAVLNAEHTIVSSAHDSFTIQVASNATATGFCGGDGVVATSNILFNAIQPQIQMISYANNNVSASAKFTAGRSLNPGANELAPLSFWNENIILNENNFIYNPAVVTRGLVGTNEKPLQLSVKIATTDEFTSPVIDTARISATLVSNTIDKAGVDSNQTGIDFISIVSGNTNVAFTTPSTISTANTATKTALKQIAVGKTIVVSGAANAANNGNFVVVEVASDGSYVKVAEQTLVTESAGSSVGIVCKDFFVSELASRGSSSASKYITKKIDLGSESTMLNIRFAASVHPLADVEVWYKTVNSSSNLSFDSVNFRRADDSNIVKSTSSEFRDVNIKVENLPSFTSCAVKLLLKSSSSSNVPLIKDLRIIACT